MIYTTTKKEARKLRTRTATFKSGSFTAKLVPKNVNAWRKLMREINRETFDASPAKTKMGLLFDSVCTIEDKIDALTTKLDRKLKIDKIYVCIGGFLGAAFALLLKEIPKWI